MHFRFLQNQCTEFVKLPTIPVELSMVVTFTGPDSHLSLSGLISLICAIKALMVFQMNSIVTVPSFTTKCLTASEAA